MKSTLSKHSIQFIASLVFAMTFSTAHSADGDASKGEAFYAVCAGCHGADGKGSEATNAPRLQGQYDWYLVRQIKNFRSGVRGAHKDDTHGTTMRAMAGTLPNDQAILDVVAYIAKLE